jgi:glycosyltransferase involved in cell wall biosynthesis
MTLLEQGASANGMRRPGLLPFVSVILPVYNDEERLPICLQALEAQTYPADRYEVIVVDNASTRPVAPLLSEFPHAIGEYETTAGSYAARNRGIAVAHGEVLAFTDADCIPDRRWIESGVETLRDQDSELAGGPIEVFPAKEPRPNPVELYEMLCAFTAEDNVSAGFTSTANLFTKRAVMDEIGTFDASLKSWGDVLWTSRAVTAGYKISFSSGASVRHPARRSLKALRLRYARFAGGHFDRARSSRQELLKERWRTVYMLRPPIRVAKRIATAARSRSLTDKATVIGMEYFTRLAYVAEWCRLELGGASRRE